MITNEYKIKEKKYNGLTVREFVPIRNEKEQKEHSEHITRVCIEILKQHKQI